jgi:hypothetical protein
MHLSTLRLAQSPNWSKRASLESRHLGVPSGAFKPISEPMVCSMQIMHLSCVKISTIAKRTEMSFHLSLILCVQNDL